MKDGCAAMREDVNINCGRGQHSHCQGRGQRA